MTVRFHENRCVSEKLPVSNWNFWVLALARILSLIAEPKSGTGIKQNLHITANLFSKTNAYILYTHMFYWCLIRFFSWNKIVMVVYFLLALIERENMCHVRSTWADFTITFLCKSWAENWLLQNIFASSIFQKVSETFLIAAKKLIHWSALFSNCIYGLHLALHKYSVVREI